MHNKKLTQERVKELLSYDKETGELRWVVKRPGVKHGSVAGFVDDKSTAKGYRCITIDQKKYLEHRVVWLYMNGYFPENDIDHINRIKTDNSFGNLRETSRQCNIRNSSISKRNKSGVTGVVFCKITRKWRSYISVNYKYKSLGFFKKKVDAIMARWNAEIKYGFPNCNSTSTSFTFLKNEGVLNGNNQPAS